MSRILSGLTFCRCFWSVDNRVLGNQPGGLLSAAAVEISSKIYLFGGFDGQTQATLFRLSLPTDLCRSINSKDDCTAVRSCSWCDVYNVTQGGNDTLAINKSACFSVTSPVPAICHAEPNVTQVKLSKLKNNVMCPAVSQWITCSLFCCQFQVVFFNGTDCSEPSDRACGTFSSCTTCLASFPYTSLNPNCGWCVGCREGGKCVKSSESCNVVHPCGAAQRKLLKSNRCFPNNCEATTCLACLGLESKCLWTPQLQWRTEVLVDPSSIPFSFKWNCWGNLADQDSLNLTVMMKTSDTCPRLCAAHRTCSTCLSSHG